MPDWYALSYELSNCFSAVYLQANVAFSRGTGWRGLRSAQTVTVRTVGYNAWLCGPVLKWVLIRMLERLNFEVDVEIWPVQMNAVEEPDIQNALDWGVLEPGVFRVWEEVLLVENKQPDAICRNVMNFRL